MPVVTPVTLDSPRVKQLSDGNLVGTVLGVSATDLIGFFGNAAPVPQPSGNAQALITRGLAAGTINYFGSSQTPISVGASATIEFSATVQAGTGIPNSPNTGDLIYVCKPSSQAGLTVGNARVKSQNVVGISLGNVTGTSIVPTASEVYSIIALRGMATIAAVLSPAAVAANTTAEQLFTVTGVRVGELVQVNKPTVQAGLEIVGCRVAANNQIGITFANYTTTAITPTAAESYTVFSLGGLDAVNNEVMLQGNLNPISLGITLTAEQTFTFATLEFGDTAIGVSKPTAQANLWVAQARISVPGTIGVTFGNIGVVSVTPTQGECYSIALRRMNPRAPVLIYSQALNPVSVAGNTSAEQTFTVTGLLVSSAVWVNKPSAQAGLGIGGVRVSAVNTLAINFVNTTGTTIQPTQGETYIIGNFQDAQPTAGNSLTKAAVQVNQSQSVLSNAHRAALVNLGLESGA